MSCRQPAQVIQAFLPQCANKPLTQCVGSGTLGRRCEDPESKVVYVLVKLLGENAVAVMQQEDERLQVRRHWQASRGVDFQGDRILIPCNDVDRWLERDLIIGS